MFTEKDLFPYQRSAISFQCQRVSSVLWLDMGLGKTVITLTTIKHLIKHGYFTNSVLIVGPIRVVETVWQQEALKWQQTQDLTFSKMLGDPDQRIRALTTPADIHLINYENLGWLSQTLKTYYVDRGHSIPFSGIVFDEITKMKNTTTNRVKAFLKIQPYVKWATGLTGTLAPNGYKDLFGQFLVIDKGERLGKTKTQFDTRFLKTQGPSGWDKYKKGLYSDSMDTINNLVSDITLEMDAADYNPLPDIIENDIIVKLDDNLMRDYNMLEREFFLEIDTLSEAIEVSTTLAMMNKCFQFSNGAVYPTPGVYEWERIHDAKLEALNDVIEEANGSSVLVAYAYRSDAERILKHFHKLNPINLTTCKGEELMIALDKWKSGNCPLMIGHPASMGHGIDGLQHNGNIVVWFGLNWSLDLYLQLNARIRRQGQTKPVMCHRILTAGTMDFVQSSVLKSKMNLEIGLKKVMRKYAQEKGYLK